MTHARTLPTALLLGVLTPALAACGGFTPLYGAQSVSPKLSAIAVARPEGRTGFLMGEALDDELARNPAEAPVYRLTLRTREVRVPRGVRINNVASRYELDLTTNWTLVEIATGKPVTQGQIQANATYDSADQPYAALAGAEDGERRAAGLVAGRIRVALAAYFASPPPKGSTAALPPATSVATYSERLQPATVLSPRERALGQPTPQGGQADIVGQPLQSTTTSPDDQRQPFSPSQDPNAIKTLPEASGQ